MEKGKLLEVESSKPCEVCGGKLKPFHSAFGVVLTCQQCQGKFGYYYTMHGEVLTYPRVWGKLVAVVQEPEGEHAALRRSGVRRAPAPPPVAIVESLALSTVFSPTYFVFLAADGTIRRVRLACIPKPPAGDRGVPETVTHHHRWNVDILRPAGQPVEGSEEKVVDRRVAGTRRRREARRAKGGRNGK